jgi:hypothetical protein
MSRLFAAVLALILPLGLAVDVASCGPTCPTLEACSSTTASSTAGTAGSSSTTCDQLTALQACFTSFCQSADNPFCTCFKRGYDLGSDCSCTTFDAAAYCQQAADNGLDASAYDCSAATGSVGSLCVVVQ